MQWKCFGFKTMAFLFIPSLLQLYEPRKEKKKFFAQYSIVALIHVENCEVFGEHFQLNSLKTAQNKFKQE